MESPQVLIPTRTNDFIIADFGNLMINNQFVTRDGDEFNSYSLVLSDMRIFYNTLYNLIILVILSTFGFDVI